ncbi:MAG: hypothetical protein HY328_15655 [Chloroflexi bacterium]|nr:hypothetical protein [Chloroflexota bacterium]
MEVDRRIARTYRLSRRTVTRLDSLADELGVHRSELVDFLLTGAFDRVEAGRWVIQTRPGRYVLDGLCEDG